ncbi:hypothetical protein ACQBAU_07660 [Propionibacteriaceae bacterium Y2011]
MSILPTSKDAPTGVTRVSRALRAVAVLGAVVMAASATTGASAQHPAGPAGTECTITAPSPGKLSGTVAVGARTSGEATRVQFYLDGDLIGHGFTADGLPGTEFSFAAYGTAAQGWSTNSTANGMHRLGCRAVAADGVGEMSDTRPAKIGNDTRAALISPRDDEDVRGDVPLVVEYSGYGALPSQAVFTMDEQELVTATCAPAAAHEGRPTVRCTATWDTVTTTADKSWDAAQGLRVIGASASVGTRTIDVAPVRTFVNNYDLDMDLLLSSYERSGLGRVGRDGGFSRELPGQPGRSFITFGDGVFKPITGPAKLQPTVGRFGNTNAIADVQPVNIPLLHEVPNPMQDPFQAPAISPLIGSTELTTPDGTPCQASTWPTGIVVKPGSDDLLIPYWSLCVYDGWFHIQAFGIAEWDATTNTAVSHDVFTNFGADLSDKYHLQSPTFDGEYLYFWRGDSTGAYQTRVPIVVDGVAEPWLDPTQYAWRSSTAESGWSTDPEQRTSVLPAGKGSFTTSISVERFEQLPGKPYLMFVQPTANTMSLYRSSSNNGPWEPVAELQDVRACETCTQDSYTIYLHPEYSTTDTLVITMSDVGTGRPFQRRLEMPASLR